MTMVISGSDGVTFPDSTTQNTTDRYGFVNRIINGDMRIDQRNAGAAVTSANGYTLDRWILANGSTGAVTVQQSSTAPTGFVNSLAVTVTTSDAVSATEYVMLRYKIEGFNTADLMWGTANAKTITLSFWVRSSLTGTFGGVISNSAQNRIYPYTYTISAADTWEQKSVTIAGDTTGTWLTTNGTGLDLTYGLGVGTDYSGTAGSWSGTFALSATGAVSVIGTLNATWYITGVQLEVGSVATPFERRPYGTELALCQRYYQLQSGFLAIAGSSTSAASCINFGTEMRASPSISLSGLISLSDISAADWTQSSASVGIPANRVNTRSIFFDITTFSGLTANRPMANTLANRVILSAEL
jgi:hypothetical protein